MTFPHILVVLSVFISLAGSIAYIKNTLTGKTKPNRISWGLWAFAPLVGTGAALSAGADVRKRLVFWKRADFSTTDS